MDIAAESFPGADIHSRARAVAFRAEKFEEERFLAAILRAIESQQGNLTVRGPGIKMTWKFKKTTVK